MSPFERNVVHARRTCIPKGNAIQRQACVDDNFFRGEDTSKKRGYKRRPETRRAHRYVTNTLIAFLLLLTRLRVYALAYEN